MSVLIEGMEMPKDRPQLLWIYPNGKALTVQSDVDPWKELQAVPVPEPHGDLIDRDMLPKSRVEWEDIVTAPTVIPAEECE